MKNKIQFCKQCLYSTAHPLGLEINEDGLCTGCQTHQEKNSLDWSERWEKLKSLVCSYKSKTGKTYDCIIPVSGGDESYFVVHVIKNLLKLNPLLVVNNKYFNSKVGIDNIANLRTKFDCDIVFQNIDIRSVKKITKFTLMEFGSIYWPIIAGQTVFPVHIALKYKIPLIIWGAHQGIEQVGMFSHLDEVEMSRWYRKNHDLMGYEAEDLITVFNDINECDIFNYIYPDDKDLIGVGIRGIYLSNYVRWDPKAQYELMIKNYGYKAASIERSFNTYDHVDCLNYMNLHDYLKMYKHGYSKVTDHAVREIRHRRISRDQAVSLVRKYEKITPRYLQEFCEWLGIERNSLNFILNQHKNKNYWPEYHSSINADLDSDRLLSSFFATKPKFEFDSYINGEKFNQKKYIYFGKGMG